METPLSRNQSRLLFRKGISPDTLNPKVKGLINRALIQRLANEEDIMTLDKDKRADYNQDLYRRWPNARSDWDTEARYDVDI